MDQFVAIPSSFFLNEAKHEYVDFRMRLIQELLQNSLDAGASRIDLTLTDSGYVCDDNGRGMTKERMVSALLTMGGSIKESGSTGGFGAAKKLLLFAHKSFAIHSNDTAVEGAGLVYKFVGCNSRKGTRVSAQYTDDFGGDEVEFKATKLLEKCNFRGSCKVYVNGVLFTDYASYRLLKSVEGLGEMYGNKRDTETQYVSVRHNGLYMFSRYISGLRWNLAFEVLAPSVEAFTQNRDGLRGNANLAFDRCITEIIVDKVSFVKPKQRKFVVQGISSFISCINRNFQLSPEIQAAVNAVRMSVGARDITPAIFAGFVASRVENSDTATMEDRQAVEEIIKFVRNNDDKLITDFHVDLADSSYRKIPPQFRPNTGKKKYTMLAALWKVCVREVLKANGLDQNFVIGFTFNSRAVATHAMRNGVSCYLVNPKSEEVDKGTKEERTMRVLTTAVHEVVHSQGCQMHDENFMLKFHELLVPTLTKGMTWRQLVKASKTEEV